MTRNQLVKSIVEETGYDKEMVANVLECFEYKVLDVIAVEDELTFAFGRFWGETKDPYRITGFFSSFTKIRELEGWSQAKVGYPHFKFSNQANYCVKIKPREYFEQPENRYTSLARKFRQDLGIPEIEEYKDLPEEKIEELCKAADIERHGKISKEKARLKERHDAWNKKAGMTRKDIGDKVLVDDDLRKQREAGVAEENLVYRSPDEIREERFNTWVKDNERFERENADWLRKKEEVRRRWLERDREREAKKAAKREEKFSQLRKENLGEDYLDELDEDDIDLT